MDNFPKIAISLNGYAGEKDDGILTLIDPYRELVIGTTEECHVFCWKVSLRQSVLKVCFQFLSNKTFCRRI